MAQHWVPQYVLRGFSVDDVHIWQYDKTGKLAPKMVPVKAACGRKDAFSARVETLLSTIESAANPAIDEFRGMERATRIDPVAKRIVAVYLAAFLWRRSPAIRDRQAAETIEEGLLTLVRDKVSRYGLPLSLYQDRLPAIAAEAASDVNRLMADQWTSSSFQRWLLYSMSWAVLRCAEPIVTIPDCGLVRLGRKSPLDPEAEFYFPLNATRVLVGSWYGVPPNDVQLLEATSAHMRQINKIGFEQAGRFVYGQDCSEKVAKVVRRPSHHFPRLKSLRITGGPNPTTTRLNDLKDWYGKVCHPDRRCCMGPGAGERFRHSWHRLPVDFPALRETPEIKTPVWICEWCQAVERQYPNGHVELDDFELRRMPESKPAQNWWQKNWWQSFGIVSTNGGIEAHGKVPRYPPQDV